MAARGQAISKAARRAWPVVLMAGERWQALSPQEQERYTRRAREAADRARRAIEKRRR